MENVGTQDDLERIPIFVLAIILFTGFFVIDAFVGEIVRLLAKFVFKFDVEGPVNLINFFLLPLGIGLVHRKPSQRGCALWLTSVIMLVSVLIGLYLLYGTLEQSVKFDWSSAFLIVAFISLAGASWWSIKRYSVYFNDDQPERVKRLNSAVVWVFVITSILFQSVQIHAHQSYKDDLDSVFALETEIYVFDEVTKKPLSRMGNFSRSSFKNHPRCDVWTMYGKGKSMGNETNFIGLRGLVVGEYKFGISHEGYEDLILSIGKDFERKPSVFLKPISADSGNE